MTKIILYSGGLDSYIGSQLLGPEYQKVYFDIRSGYSDKEIDNIYQHGVIVDSHVDLRDLERPDGFVPQRNVLFVTLAQAKFDADEIALCGVRGEFSRDKHPKFYRDMSKLLSYTAGKPVRVFSPFEKKTKSQALKWWLDTTGSLAGVEDLIRDTISCYSAYERACGRCMSCFRRWVALENNDLAMLENWWDNPWETKLHKPSQLAKLPVSMYWDFALAQRDVVTAYYRLWQRTGYRPGMELIK